VTTPGRQLARRIAKRVLAGVHNVLTIALSVVVVIIAIVLFVTLVDGGGGGGGGDSTPTTTTNTGRQISLPRV